MEGDITQGSTVFVARSAPLGLPQLLVNLGYPTELSDPKTHAEAGLADLREVFGEVSVQSEGAVSLPSGVEAYEYDILFTAGDLPFGAKMVTVRRASVLFHVFAQTIEADFAGRLPEMERLAHSIRLFQPAPFGVSRDQGLAILRGGPSSLDPHLIGDAASYYYIVQIYSGLVGLSQDLEIVPDLAERWEVLDNGTTYVFHLRPDARFHSGKQVTAEDVKFSIERAADPQTGSRTAQIYLDDIVGVKEKLAGTALEVAGVQVIDERTVQFKITQPVPYFLAKMTHPAGFVVERDNVAQGASWFFQPDGSGPFKLLGWEPPFALVLERNDYYYREQARVPYILVWTFRPNALAMYEAGEVDITPVGVADLEEIREGPLKDELLVVPELTIFYMGFNTRQSPFDDPRARRAFAMAADIDAIIQQDLAGAVTRAAGIMPQGLPGFNADLQPLPYDPQAAKALWDEVVAEKGAAATTVTVLVSGGILTDNTASLIDAWREVLGVEINLAGANINDLRRAVELSEAHIFDFGWVADYPDPQNFLDILFHSQAPNNFGSYSNPAVDGLLERARTEVDEMARLDLYQEAEMLMMADVPAIPLWFGGDHVLVKPHVRDWHVSAQQVPSFRQVSLDRPLTPRTEPPPPTATPPPTSTPRPQRTATV